jgi:uncharacterized protein YbjT (DUF2867 family)
VAKTAVIVGASGLVGIEVVQLLLQDDHYDRVVVLVRGTLAIQHQKLEQEIVDFDRLDKVAHYLVGADVFCTLGTTIKKAGSKSAFIKVDQQYPFRLAELSKQQGAASFLIVTALGANPQSSIFYSQVKGKLEDQLKKLELSRLHIFQPSLLLGNRTEHRFGERFSGKLMTAMAFMFVGSLSKYKAIPVHTVAMAMIKAAKDGRQGNYTYTSDKITDLVQK